MSDSAGPTTTVTMPAAEPAATPAPDRPAATPAPDRPAATPAPDRPAATPAPHLPPAPTSPTSEARPERAPRPAGGGGALTRGPALALGTVLLAAGLYFLHQQHGFPRWANFPDGHAPVGGKAFFGVFGINGFTGELTAVAGGLLLLGGTHRVPARAISLLVGAALGAAAVIAWISGDVLGLAAANGWTEVGWGASAALLLLNTGVPHLGVARLRRRRR